MKLFKSIDKDKEQTGSGCQKEQSAARIRILGSGCAKCQAVEAAVRQAISQLVLDVTVDHVTDFGRIAAYGVMATPALVIDGKVVASGRVITTAQAAALIEKNLQ